MADQSDIPRNQERPRILVTGFSVFPGAPVNPTEKLVERLRGDSDFLAAFGDIRTEIFAVEYDSLQANLERIGAEFPPDIAVHFGLSAKAHGFTLERVARNEIAPGRPDNAGRQPDAVSITAAGGNLGSTLPLEALYRALAEKGLPISWSDDAGGYLCNYLFYLSRAGMCRAFAPQMTGFIHVPPLDDGQDGPAAAMALDDLTDGARVIVAICAAAWQARSGV